jgi:hypothetical protein
MAASWAGCSDSRVRTCQTGADCVQGGVPGKCLPSPSSADMFCAYPDPMCASGDRWGLLAGDDLAKACVTATGPDAGGDVTLTVTRDGNGTGTVVSQPAGIDCGTTCSATFPNGTEVQLSASAEAASFFMGWTGPCAQQAACAPTLDGDTQVGATFALTGTNQWLAKYDALADSANSVAVSPSGDVFVVGGRFDKILIAKISGLDGHALWSKNFAHGQGGVWDVAATPDGDVVFVAVFDGIIDLDGQQIPSPNHGLIAKLDGATGAVKWAQAFQGPSVYTQNSQRVVVGADGSVYVAGLFNKSFTFAGTTLMTDGSANIYVLKLTSAGEPAWAFKQGSAGETVAGLALTPGDTALVLGATFYGETVIGQYFRQAVGASDGFIATFDPLNRTHLSMTVFSGPMADSVTDVAVTSTGDVAVLGKYEGSYSIGGAVLPGPSGVFVATYSQAGAHRWSKGFNASTLQAEHVARGPDDGLWITGTISGSTQLAGATLIPAGQTDAVVLKLDAEGTPLWATNYGGTMGEGIAGIVASPQQIVVGGAFSGLADFGPEQLMPDTGGDFFFLSIVP